MREFLRYILQGVSLHRKPIILLAGLALGLVVLLSAAYWGLSHNEKTCLVCHYLQPYYNLWSKSSHRDVPCVACHPDRKFLMGGYALRYITASYTARPIAQVEDEYCLKCHEGQTLDTAEPFEQNIVFNHKEHLRAPMRGVKLHCITCHNHRTPGSYLKVDHQACFLCHFKGAQRGQSQTGCQTCHGNPKQEVEHQGFMFGHQAYIDVGINCGQCHIDVVKGDAAVPQEACFTCHISRVEKFKDFSLVHEVHVTNQKINCFNCHGAIEHGKFGMISSLEVRCEACHVRLHTPEKQLYIGSGGHGTPDEPSRMFLAQVSCDGCHIKEEAIGEVAFGAKARKTRRESCLSCHGQGYDLMLDDWLKATPEMLAALESPLKSAESALISGERSGRDAAEAKTMIAEARYNFDFVKEGRATHNIFYSLHLLKDAAQKIQEAKKDLGGPETLMEFGPLLGASDGYCSALCHSHISRREVLSYEKMAFPHTMHEQDLELSCTTCHDATKHRQKVVVRQACKQCHHVDYPINCTNCHWREDELYRGESSELGLQGSPDFMATAKIGCKGCHDLGSELSQEAVAKKCVACHDKDYAQTLEEWKTELAAAQQSLAVELDSAEASLKFAKSVGRRVWDENQAIGEIRKRAEFLSEAGVLHNYAVAAEQYAALGKKLAEVQQRLRPEP